MWNIKIKYWKKLNNKKYTTFDTTFWDERDVKG